MSKWLGVKGKKGEVKSKTNSCGYFTRGEKWVKSESLVGRGERLARPSPSTPACTHAHSNIKIEDLCTKHTPDPLQWLTYI